MEATHALGGAAAMARCRYRPDALPYLFHGTCERLVGTPRPGAYDEVFWTAECSAVAQCYIPASSGSVYLAFRSFELDDYVRPGLQHAALDLARHIGPVPFDVEYDPRGSARSWRVPQDCVRNRDIVHYVQHELGYANQAGWPGDYLFEVRTSSWSEREGHVFQHAGYRMPGALVVVSGFGDLRFLDLSMGDSDLLDLQYHKLATFKAAQAHGYDAVVIDDFVQSETWGSIGHRSVGFFAAALPRLRFDVVPCVRFDWPKEDLSIKNTPEYLGWLRLTLQRGVVPAGA